jgi:signal peptidase I
MQLHRGHPHAPRRRPLDVTLSVLLIFTAAVALTIAVAASARLFLCVVVIEGSSMMPTLGSGDRVLATLWWPKRWFRTGDLVLMHRPHDRLGAASRLMIKRIAVVGEADIVIPLAELPQYDERRRSRTTGSCLDGQIEFHLARDEFFVAADNPDGADSRVWGPVSDDLLVGPVVIFLARSSLTSAKVTSLPTRTRH